MLDKVTPGMRELEVAAAGDAVCKTLGAYGYGYDTMVCSGPRINTIIGRSSNRVIQQGDLAMLGVSPRFEGYTSALGRTVVAGGATAEQAAFLDHGIHAHELAVTQLVAGTPARDVDLAARRYLNSVGLAQYHTYGVGHGIGFTECLEGKTATQLSDYDLPAGIAIMIDVNGKTVSVTAEVAVQTSFLMLAGVSSLSDTIQSTAAAKIDSQPVCILALSPDFGTGIEFGGRGEMKAKDCVVWSNAAGMQSIVFDGSGKVSASRICARGRVSSLGRFTVKPEPQGDCPLVSDPMLEWQLPEIKDCTFKIEGWVTQTTAQLDPGVYCGGLRVDAKNIFMSPGLYVIKDGPLVLRGASKISGKEVGILMSGGESRLDIDGKSQVELAAAKEGAMAGIVIAAARDALPQHSSITGRSDLKIGGVIYLPTHKLTYWGESDTRAASPVTTIIANTISIGGESFLEVKNDKSKAKYAPIVATAGGTVRLIE